MNKTTAIVLIAAMSVAAMIPAGSAELNARTFFDVAAGAEFGQGAGLYDPTQPPVYCAALLSFYQGISPVLFYYTTPVRYEPGAALSVLVPVGGPGVADPTGCAGEVPGSQVFVDLVEVDAGAAVWSFNLLGDTQVANLGATEVEFEYCAAPTAVAGSQAGLDVLTGTVTAFMARHILCLEDPTDLTSPNTAWIADYTLYDAAGACNVFTMSTSLGVLDGDQPVFLVDGQSCNTLVGSGSSNTAVSLALLAVTGSDYAAQHCVKTVTTNTVNGATANETDSDFFVVGHDGSLLGWATTTVLPPVGMFENVANLEADAPAPSCFA